MEEVIFTLLFFAFTIFCLFFVFVYKCMSNFLHKITFFFEAQPFFVNFWTCVLPISLTDFFSSPLQRDGQGIQQFKNIF